MVENINTKFTVSAFVKQVGKLSVGQKDAIKKTGFGPLLLMPNQKLSKTLLAVLMDRWSCKKKAFVLPPGDIGFSLMDVALILGLPVVGEPVVLSDKPFSDLEREYGAIPEKRDIPIAAIEKRLESLKMTVNDDFIRTFLLFTFGVLLFPNANGTVDSRYLSFMEDVDKLQGYAWGAAVRENLHLWLEKRKKQRIEYVGGCLIFIQVWCYAHIDIARPLQEGRNLHFPRFCRWKNSSSYTRQWFTEKFDKLIEDQVIWELNPTAEDSRIDTVRELLEMQKESLELPSTSGVIGGTSEVQKVAMEATQESESPSVGDTYLPVNAETSEYTVTDDGVTSEDTAIDIDREPPEIWNVIVEETQASQSSSAVNTDEVDSLRSEKEMLEKQVSEMEEVIEELQKENLERKQMSEKQMQVVDNLRNEKEMLEKQVSEMEEVIEELRRENLKMNQTSEKQIQAVDSLKNEKEMLENQVSEMEEVIEALQTKDLSRNQMSGKQISDMEGVIKELRRENEFLRNHLLSSNNFIDHLERIVLSEDLNDQ